MTENTQAKIWSDGPVSFYGLSTETKPTTSDAPGSKTAAIPARSTFLETDTGDEYIWTSENWFQYKNNGRNIAADTDDFELQNDILCAINKSVIELKKINLYLEMMNDQKITNEDVE